MCARQYALPRYTCLSTCRHSVSQKIVWQRKTKTPRAKKNPLYKSKSYPIYWCIIISVVSLSLAGAMHDALAVVGAIVIPLNSFIVARECEFVCAPPNILFGDGRRCIVLWLRWQIAGIRVWMFWYELEMTATISLLPRKSDASHLRRDIFDWRTHFACTRIRHERDSDFRNVHYPFLPWEYAGECTTFRETDRQTDNKCVCA